jgi:branched-chain amino acid aminotransferase
MAFNFNGNIIRELPEQTDALLRAVQYGDTLFETMRMFDSEMPFLDRHIHRLKSGMELTGMLFSEDWDRAFFETAIQKVATGNARIRWMVWRSPGGLYRPENNAAQFMVTTSPLYSSQYEWPEKPVTIGICPKVRLPVDAFSNIKTLNAPRYIQAGIAAQQNGWDDGILLNQYGRICEATSSNIFWWDVDGCLCTPALTEGCVAGIMRDHIILVAQKQGISVKTKDFMPEVLDRAVEILLTNAIRGIVPAIMAGGKTGQYEQTKRLFGDIGIFSKNT